MKKTIKLLGTVFIITYSTLSFSQTEKAVYKCSFDCPSCEEKVMKNIPYEKGVKDVSVDYENKLVTVEYKTNKNNKLNMQKALVNLGYHTQFLGNPSSFNVNGNCGMCKERIENAAKSLDEVTIASWDTETKLLTVIFNSDNIQIKDIHQAIANVGHDTELIKADNDLYEALHACCKYDR